MVCLLIVESLLGLVQAAPPPKHDDCDFDHAGTWATHTVAADSDLVVVPAPSSDSELSAVALSAGVGAPALASALLQFADIKDGDVVVQTNAQSAVAQVVAQMAAERGAMVVSIFPDHPSFDEMSLHLSALNPAGFSVRESTARTPEFAKLLSDLPRAALAIDGAGGSAAISAASALRPGGVLVSYANTSRRPIILPMTTLLEKGITVRGFNLDGWAREVTVEQRRELARSCAEATAFGKYTQLLQTETFAHWDEAIKAQANPFSRRVVMRFD